MVVSSKKCSKCGRVLPLVAFGKEKKAKDGLKSACKECRRAAAKQYHKENPEKVRESNRKSSRKYRKDNPEKVRESNRKSCGKYRQENPEKIKDYGKQYRKDNPEKIKAKNHKRRARKKNAPGDATPEQIKARMDYHGNKCIYCGSSENIEIEHMIPLANGGGGWASNLAPACKSCNCSKGTMPFFEFVAKKAKEGLATDRINSILLLSRKNKIASM